MKADINDRFSISHDYIFSVFLDKNDGLWVSTKYNGINYCSTAQKWFRKHYMLGDKPLKDWIVSGFVETEDEFDEDQVAYYYKDDQSIDFDVYQWAKNDTYVLEEEAAYFAAEYGTTATEVTVNGIPGMQYISTEEYEGAEYTVINYMFDDGENIVELCFWTNASAAEYAVVEEILNTLKMN
jgi:hypothetical protein